MERQKESPLLLQTVARTAGKEQGGRGAQRGGQGGRQEGGQRVGREPPLLDYSQVRVTSSEPCAASRPGPWGSDESPLPKGEENPAALAMPSFVCCWEGAEEPGGW